jgi:hypothetical protein
MIIKLIVSEIIFCVGTGQRTCCINMKEKKYQLFVASHKKSPEDI